MNFVVLKCPTISVHFLNKHNNYLTKAIILSCITAVNHKIYDCEIIVIGLIRLPINNGLYFSLNISQKLVNRHGSKK